MHYYLNNLGENSFSLNRKDSGFLNACGEIDKEEFWDYFRGILLEDEDESWYDMSMDYAGLKMMKIVRALRKNGIFKFDFNNQRDESRLIHVERKFR